MHPVIAEAIVAERTRDIQGHAAAAGRARRLRRSRRSGRTWLSAGISRAGRGRAWLPAPRSLRGPRPA